MQKIINVLAVSAGVVSLAVVGSGLYVYVQRDKLINNIKSQVMEAVSGSLPSLVDTKMPSLPTATGGALTGPGLGMGIPKF